MNILKNNTTTKPLNQNRMKTAVEWLEEQIKWRTDITDIIEQAKEMEKEQIMDAYLQGQYDGDTMRDTDAEQYYNETFKSE